MNCVFMMCLTDAFLFKAYYNFKEAVAAIHLSGTVIISGGHLQLSSIFNATVFFFKQALVIVSVFKDTELIHLQLQLSIRRMALFLL